MTALLGLITVVVVLVLLDLYESWAYRHDLKAVVCDEQATAERRVQLAEQHINRLMEEARQALVAEAQSEPGGRA